MKKSMLFAYFILFSSVILRGQNLVVNPSFEIASDSVSLIPPGEFSATKAMGWSLPTRAQATLYGSIPTIATTNRAMNRWKFTAKTGNNVIGIMTYGSILTDEKNELLTSEAAFGSVSELYGSKNECQMIVYKTSTNQIETTLSIN